MRKHVKELAAGLLLAGTAAVALLASEIRWQKVNSPAGKFVTAGGYLDHGRLPSRVTILNKAGSNYFIAYSPMDSRFAFPSGPAAYVFDGAGRMVDWSSDSGDDTGFKKAWPLEQQKPATLENLKGLGPSVR